MPTVWVVDDAPSMTAFLDVVAHVPGGRGSLQFLTLDATEALVVADMRASWGPRDGSLFIDWPYGQTSSRPNGRCSKAPQEDGAEGARGIHPRPAHPYATAISARRGNAAQRPRDQLHAGHP